MSLSQTTQSNILIVDDTPENLTVLIRMLTKRGYQVRPAISGPVALKAVRKNPPDLILLDIMMSEMDGYEVCRRLKSDKTTRDIPVIFISALNEAIDKIKAFQVGGVDYVTKPFQAEEVFVRVETHLALRNLQKHLQQQNALLQREITERKKMEEGIIKEHNLLRTLIESLPELIYVKDVKGCFLIANKAVLHSRGLTSQDELVGKTDFDFLPKDLAEKFYKTEQMIINSGQPVIHRQELIFNEKTGVTKWVLSSKVPFRDKHDNIVGLVGLDRDITQLKQREKAVQSQAILLRGVTEAMRRLLVSPKFEASITEALEVLGFVLEVDRISIFETHEHPKTKKPLMSQRFTWAEELPEVQINIPKLQNIPYEQRFTRWHKIFSSNDILSGLVREFPSAEQAVLKSWRIVSMMAAPITVHQRLWGFISFEDCQTEREWDEIQMFILLAMAESIGSAIARRQA